MVEAKRTWNRREAIGLTLATTFVLAGCGKAARESGAAGRKIANRGTIVEASDAGAGSLHLTSLRNKATGFEWLMPRRPFVPLAISGSGVNAGQPQAVVGVDGRGIVAFLAAKAPNRDFTVVIDRDSGAIVDKVMLKPWT